VSPQPAPRPDDAVEVLRAVWSAEGQNLDPDAECGPQTSCRNMVGVSFDGMAEPGTDLNQAWRDRLESEGKRAGSEASIRDLVLGRPAHG